jgi:hypothetical protein
VAARSYALAGVALGSLALGAGGASAAPERHSVAQRVTEVTSEGYSATVRFDRRDRPRVAALPGRSDVLGRSGRVRSLGSCRPTTGSVRAVGRVSNGEVFDVAWAR